MSEWVIDKLLAEVNKVAGVEHKGHHANRRGAARASYDETLDIVSVQAFLGHKSTEMTQIYIGMDLEKTKTAQNGITKAINGVKMQKGLKLKSEEAVSTVDN